MDYWDIVSDLEKEPSTLLVDVFCSNFTDTFNKIHGLRTALLSAFNKNDAHTVIHIFEICTTNVDLEIVIKSQIIFDKVTVNESIFDVYISLYPEYYEFASFYITLSNYSNKCTERVFQREYLAKEQVRKQFTLSNVLSICATNDFKHSWYTITNLEQPENIREIYSELLKVHDVVNNKYCFEQIYKIIPDKVREKDSVKYFYTVAYQNDNLELFQLLDSISSIKKDKLFATTLVSNNSINIFKHVWTVKKFTDMTHVLGWVLKTNVHYGHKCSKNEFFNFVISLSKSKEMKIRIITKFSEWECTDAIKMANTMKPSLIPMINLGKIFSKTYKFDVLSDLFESGIPFTKKLFENWIHAAIATKRMDKVSRIIEAATIRNMVPSTSVIGTVLMHNSDVVLQYLKYHPDAENEFMDKCISTGSNSPGLRQTWKSFCSYDGIRKMTFLELLNIAEFDPKVFDMVVSQIENPLMITIDHFKRSISYKTDYKVIRMYYDFLVQAGRKIKTIAVNLSQILTLDDYVAMFVLDRIKKIDYDYSYLSHVNCGSQVIKHVNGKLTNANILCLSNLSTVIVTKTKQNISTNKCPRCSCTDSLVLTYDFTALCMNCDMDLFDNVGLYYTNKKLF